MLKQLTENDVEFIIECLPEDSPITGNAIATGDKEEDEKYERQLIENLKHNEWAWCMVRVTAKWNEFVGWDILGACSYASQQDFMDCEYYADMKKRALDDLNAEIKITYDKIDTLVE